MYGPVARLRDNIVASIMVGNRPIIWGPAGVGKSSLVADIAKQLKRMMVTIIPALCDPTDINGFPIPNRETRTGKGETGRSYPVIEFAPRRSFLELNSNPTGGILFWDEFTGASAAVRSAVLRTLIEGVAGDFEFHPDVAMIAAANPPDEAVNGQELEGPIVNRFDHFDFPSHTGTGEGRTVNNEAVVEWCDNVVGWWGNPDGDWKTDRGPVETHHMVRARQLVSEFVRRRPELWHKPNPDVCTAGWPSPRSWARASRHLALVLARNEPPMSCLDRITSSVGSAAAIEFQTYIDNNDLPDPESVLDDPLGWKFSGRPDVDYAVLVAVVAAVQANLTVPRVLAALEVAGRSADRTGGPVKEAAMVALRPLGQLIEHKSESYKRLVKGMSALEQTEFNAKVAKILTKFQSIMTLLA